MKIYQYLFYEVDFSVFDISRGIYIPFLPFYFAILIDEMTVDLMWTERESFDFGINIK